jgi:transposase InsO family protein/dUTPase
LGQMENPKTLDPQQSVPRHLVGEPNELDGSIGSVNCKTLVDTGSQVSTVAQHFYETHLSHIELIDCQNLLRVEGAGGVQIPYLGYIFTELRIEGTAPVAVPVLVVQNTEYNTRVPVIIGTNYLRIVECNPGGEVSQTVRLAKQSVELVERHLQRSDGVYGTVYATDTVTINPGHIQVICGSVRITVPITRTVGMVSASSNFQELEVTPCVVNIDNTTRSSYVELVNLSENAIVIDKGQKIAELHHVAVEANSKSSEVDDGELWKTLDIGHLEKHVTSDELHSVKHMLTKWRHIFSTDSMDLGKTSVLKHRIDLHDSIPIKEKARRIPPNMIEELRDHIQQLHSMGVIEESVSPWSSPIVLVRKKSGELRMCVDYRKLNAKTVKDSYRIPTIEELIDTLGGAKWFATLDLSSGYHQVMIEDADKEKTAFTAGPLGFWQYRRMPFGLCNAPALFQRMMERVLSGIHLKTALVYLDDIIVFGESVSELQERLGVVFAKVNQAGLKLKAQKCSLFRQELKYLGHIVSHEGVRCDPDLLAPVREWKPPQDVKELQRFLGFANFFRRFIKGFASIAQPLTELMGSPKTKGKHSRTTKTESKPWIWKSTEQASFDNLKEALLSPPLLAYPDFTKPFIVRTDASTHGLGAVLCQDQGAKAGPQVIAYASRSLKPSEKHYSPYKLEFLGLFWAVTVKFQDYLKGASFTVLTDHNPLTYILTSAKLDSTGHRWLAQLSNFQFDIKYKPGRLNGDADALSRMSEESVKAACRLDDSWDGYAQCMQVSVDRLSVSDCVQGETIKWSEEQDKDPTCKRVKTILMNGSHVTSKKEDINVIRLLRRRKQLEVNQSILYRTSGQERKVVVPSHLQKKLISMCHDDMGHQGRDRTHSLLSERFYWPSMLNYVGTYIASCGRCVRAKTHLPDRAPLHPIVTTEPLEVVCMDFMTLELSKGGYSSILVITDHFTKFSVSVPTRNQTAKTTAKALLDHWIYTYGIPRRLHSDQGANFESKLIKQLCSAHGISKSRTSPYHPEGDGATERMNRTLLNMLRTLNDDSKTDWKAHLDRLMYAYNTTPHSSTGFSPYYLMFGRGPNLPVDALLPERPSASNYVDEIKHRLKDAYKLALQKNQDARAHQKKHYDLKVRGATPEVGDDVLVKRLAFTGKHKLEDKWEPDVYNIIGKRDPDIPVYELIKKDGSGKKRMLHRNHIMPLLQTLRDTPLTDAYSPKRQPSRTLPSAPSSSDTTVQRMDELDELDESSDEILSHVVDIDKQDPKADNLECIEHNQVESNSDAGSSDTDENENGTLQNTEDDSDSESTHEGDDNTDDDDNNEVNEEVESERGHSETDDNTDSDQESSEETSHPLRRSTRARRPPDRYGVALTHQHRVYSDWKDRVDVLVQLVTLFPHKADKLYEHIIHLVIG